VPTVPNPPPLLHGFDPTLLLVLNLTGTFVFGLSGGLTAVRARLDLVGVAVLAVAVGLAGGIIRDLLIGVPPATFRDWRYLAVASGAGFLAYLAPAIFQRYGGPIDIVDAGGLSLFCVTGAAAALQHRVGAPEAVVLGAITGIGGGMLRDVLVREIPVVLREGLYALPALIGATIVVVAWQSGARGLAAPIAGAAVCFAIRLVGLYRDINLPTASETNALPLRRSSTPRD
jgi:uncharacterized membrane protein YeiH